MKPLEYPLLADENIHPKVVAALVEEGRNVVAAQALGLGGATDADVLERAHREGRVVLTHDSDFGRLAVRDQQPYTGIIYLRPGHIDPTFTLRTLDAVRSAVDDVSAPFIIVAERRADTARVRLVTQTMEGEADP